MLSAFPFSFESVFTDHFPDFEPGFSSMEGIEPVVFTPQISHEPISSNSGSDASNASPVTPSSPEPVLFSPSTGSDSSNPNPTSEPDNNPEKKDNQKSGSVEPARFKSKRVLDPNALNERKRRRMTSNRDSARRSRMRKQRHLENLRNLLNRLKITNREASDRVRVLMYQNHVVRRENECLRSEAVVLRQRLWDIRQVLVVKQLQQHLMNINNTTYAWPCSNNNNNNYSYSKNNNVMPASNINNDEQLKHHSLIA